jgi:Flp pilus assembly protein TadG
LKASRGRERRDDAGNALVEFVLVSVLVVFIAVGVVQLALTLHVRNILISGASEGAHFAALADRSLAEGQARATSVVHGALPGYEIDVTARTTEIAGAPGVAVEIAAPVPVIGLWGAGAINVEGRAYREVDRDAVN